MIKGTCPVCEFHFALRRDGTIWRHFASFTGANSDGTCSGWKQLPKVDA